MRCLRVIQNDVFFCLCSEPSYVHPPFALAPPPARQTHSYRQISIPRQGKESRPRYPRSLPFFLADPASSTRRPGPIRLVLPLTNCPPPLPVLPFSSYLRSSSPSERSFRKNSTPKGPTKDFSSESSSSPSSFGQESRLLYSLPAHGNVSRGALSRPRFKNPPPSA